jgi:hypothetical protein
MPLSLPSPVLAPLPPLRWPVPPVRCLGDDTIWDWGSGDGVLRNAGSSSGVLRWRGERRSARSDRVGGGVLAKDAFGCCRLSLGAPKAYTVDQRQMWFCLSKMGSLIGVSVRLFPAGASTHVAFEIYETEAIVLAPTVPLNHFVKNARPSQSRFPTYSLSSIYLFHHHPRSSLLRAQT